MVTVEEAKRCPICKEPGEETNAHRLGNGQVMLTITCRNKRCRWNDTNWLIQKMPDGTVAERRKGEKEYPALDPYQKARAQAQIDQLRDEDPHLR
jgi:hypothetical protein